MDAWREDCFNALLSIDSEQELFTEVARIAKAIGFEYCSYGIRMPVPISRPKVAVFFNYADQWQERYQERGYIHVDPTVKHAFSSNLPILWSDKVFEPAREMWEEARGHGLQFGWAQPSRDASGAVGLLTLARSAGQLAAAELASVQAKMTWLVQYAHAGMSRLMIPRLAPETKVALTAREKEVLRWTAEGKTAYEIAQILTVSERTVNFHINNVVAKLGTTNKTQAAVKAAALGMLA